jgi:hypothetical protein
MVWADPAKKSHERHPSVKSGRQSVSVAIRELTGQISNLKVRLIT